jgi:hypothetical protein
VRVEKARGSMPNNTGEFAARVEALRARLEGAQLRLADVAKQQNELLESLARSELEQQKERIGTYQIQARFALASIYDRAALGGGAVSAPAGGQPSESQGELEQVQPEQVQPEQVQPEQPIEEAPPAAIPPAESPDASPASPTDPAAPPPAPPAGETP